MDKLEKVYREKLYDYQSEVSSSVWQHISLSLDRKNRNRRIIICMIVITVITILMSGIYFWVLYTGKTITPPQKKTSELATGSNTVYEKNFSPFAKNNKSIDDIPQSLQSKELKKSENLSYIISNVGSSVLSSSKEFQYPEEALSNNQIFNEIVEINGIPGLSGELNYVSGNDNFINNINFKNKYLHQLYYKKRRGILDDCFPSKVNSWLIEANVAPLYGAKSLKGNNEMLLNSRINSENPLISYNTSIRIGYNYRGAILKTGVDYTSINEKFKILLKNVISTQTIITIDTIKHSDGTYTITRDTTIKEIYGEEDIKKFNSYRMLGIPVIIGYELKYQRHSFGLNAGVIINLMLRKSGSILNKDGKISDIGDSESLVFVNRTGASFYSSLFYAYSLNDRFAVFAEPRFTFDLFPITKKEYDLKQKYLTYGLSFGGRFLF